MTETKTEAKEIVKSIKKLEKYIAKTKTEFKAKNKRLTELQRSLENAKKWKLSLIEVKNKEGEINTYTLPYPSKIAKNLMENFLTFEAKHPYENIPGGLKISRLTHHSFCNIPVTAGSYENPNKRTDKILFYPAEKIETEKEYTFIKIKEKKNRYLIEIIKIYEDLALKKLLMYKIEKIEMNKDLIDLPSDIKKLDLQSIKAQAIAISKEEARKKIPLKERTVIYKEMHPIDSHELLAESKIIKENERIKAEIANEDGEITTYETLYSQRPVAFTVFGIGYEKEMGWFPCATIINVFKRKDILSKKLPPEEYLEKHSYHLNGKKLQVNYKNLYLKGIYKIDKIPTLWSYASLSANEGKLNITIPIPIQRKMKNEWKRVKPSSIAKAVYQILKTEKIKYKGEEIYLPGKRKFIEKELINIKEPEWLQEGLELIRETVNCYKILQMIKRGVDKLENSVENIEELTEIIEEEKNG